MTSECLSAKGYCFRVHPMTVIPGEIIRSEDSSGNVTEIENTQAYIIIQSSTEMAIDINGNKHKYMSQIMRDGYFFDQGEAYNKAIDLHEKSECVKPRCGWTVYLSK